MRTCIAVVGTESNRGIIAHRAHVMQTIHGCNRTAPYLAIGRGLKLQLDALWETFQANVADRIGDDLAVRTTAGGYPAAVTRSTARRCASWYRSYVETR